MYIASAIFLAAVSSLSVSAKKFGVDYCAMDCSPKLQHLMCKFQPATHGNIGECTHIRGSMTPRERMHIMDLHNTYRNEMAMDHKGVMGKYNATVLSEDANGNELNLTYGIYKGCEHLLWKEPPLTYAQGFVESVITRELTWSYENEKMAQVYSQQCTGDNELYQCIRDFKEEFDQWMSMYTEEGTGEGEELFHRVFDSWVSTNTSVPGDNDSESTSNKYVQNNFQDFKFNNEMKYLPWASIVYYRTFLFGCGKSHYRLGEKDMTRVVCVYGPGINYIDTLRNEEPAPGDDPESPSLYDLPVRFLPEPGDPGFQGGGILELKPRYSCATGTKIKPVGEDEDWGVSYPAYNYQVCSCRLRGNPRETYGPSATNSCKIFTDEFKYGWLCNNDCTQGTYFPLPIPDVLDFMKGVRGAAPSVHPLPVIFLSIFLTSLRLLTK